MMPNEINPRLPKFIWAGIIFFAWSIVQGAIQGQDPVRSLLEQGPGGMIGGAHTHIGLMGWMSLVLMALVYYLVPLISNKSIAWPKLVDWVFWIWVICEGLSGILLIIGGALGGNAFAAGVKGEELDSIIMPYAISGGLLCTIAVIGGLMFVVQILVSLSRSSKTP